MIQHRSNRVSSHLYGCGCLKPILDAPKNILRLLISDTYSRSTLQYASEYRLHRWRQRWEPHGPERVDFRFDSFHRNYMHNMMQQSSTRFNLTFCLPEFILSVPCFLLLMLARVCYFPKLRTRVWYHLLFPIL